MGSAGRDASRRVRPEKRSDVARVHAPGRRAGVRRVGGGSDHARRRSLLPRRHERVRRVARVVRHQRLEHAGVRLGPLGLGAVHPLGAEPRGGAVQRYAESLELARDGGPHDVVQRPRGAQVPHVHRVLLPDPVRAVLRLQHRRGDPVQLSEHHVAGGGERDPLAARLDGQNRHA